jgi:hypothetical protein
MGSFKRVEISLTLFAGIEVLKAVIATLGALHENSFRAASRGGHCIAGFFVYRREG